MNRSIHFSLVPLNATCNAIHAPPKPGLPDPRKETMDRGRSIIRITTKKREATGNPHPKVEAETKADMSGTKNGSACIDTI